MTDSSISGRSAPQRTRGSYIPSSSHVVANMFIHCGAANLDAAPSLQRIAGALDRVGALMSEERRACDLKIGTLAVEHVKTAWHPAQSQRCA